VLKKPDAAKPVHYRALLTGQQQQTQQRRGGGGRCY